MRTAIVCLLTGTLLVTLTVQSHAQIPETVRKQMDFLVGGWEVEGTHEDQKVTGHFDIRWAPGQSSLVMKSTYNVGGTILEANVLDEFKGDRIKKDDSWSSSFTQVDGNGTTESSTLIWKIVDANTFTIKNTKRKRGDKELPEITEHYVRKVKK